MAAPLTLCWTGKAFVPSDARVQREAASRFGEGEVVTMDEIHVRSKKNHDHFFAVVTEAWETMPEHQRDRFPTSESLRHYALCKSGYCDVETFSASSRAEALRLAAFVRKGAVIVTVDGPVVTRLTPHSQSQRAMGDKTFKESKAACLEVIAGLLDVEPAALAKAAA